VKRYLLNLNNAMHKILCQPGLVTHTCNLSYDLSLIRNGRGKLESTVRSLLVRQIGRDFKVWPQQGLARTGQGAVHPQGIGANPQERPNRSPSVCLREILVWWTSGLCVGRLVVLLFLQQRKGPSPEVWAHSRRHDLWGVCCPPAKGLTCTLGGSQDRRTREV
jgi:hypothetical protein